MAAIGEKSEERRAGWSEGARPGKCKGEKERERKSEKRRPGKKTVEREVRDSPHKHLECDTLVSSTHIKVMGCGGAISRQTGPANFGSSRDGGGKERRLFVALFDFAFTEIAFTYAPRTEIKQIRKCLQRSRRPPDAV